MAVYRESQPAWRRYLLIVIGIVALVVALLVILAISRPATSGSTDRIGANLDLIAQSVDLFVIEYAKVAKGTPAAQTGAPGAIDRAQAAFTVAEANLRALDDPAASALAKDLAALKAALTAPTTRVEDLTADVNAQILAIRRARQSTPGR